MYRKSCQNVVIIIPPLGTDRLKNRLIGFAVPKLPNGVPIMF